LETKGLIQAAKESKVTNNVSNIYSTTKVGRVFDASHQQRKDGNNGRQLVAQYDKDDGQGNVWRRGV
jgi:hypothetical protein